MEKMFNGYIFDEETLQDVYRGYNGKGLPPTLTEIRNFVPKRQWIGDYEFQITKDQLRDFMEWKMKHPSTDM